MSDDSSSKKTAEKKDQDKKDKKKQKSKNEQELGKAWEQDGNGACDEKKRKE